MASRRWMLAVCLSLLSVLGTSESAATTESVKYTCGTFGSGVVRPFRGAAYSVRSSCAFTLTRFTHNRVECDVTTRRGEGGLLVEVEVIVNKVKTVLRNGSVLVDEASVSLPFDHTYQHVFQYGVYTRLRSSLLPLSVTWHDVPGGIDALWVELEQELSADVTGLCGKHNGSDSGQQLIAANVLPDDTCQTRDPVSATNAVCRKLLSQLLDCLQTKTSLYLRLCEENIYGYENSKYIGCAFYKEVVHRCGNKSHAWSTWRTLTKCESPTCPGDLSYVEEGPAFIPSCSNPNPRLTSQGLTSTCVCPKGLVLNDRAHAVHCVNVSSCPCAFAGKTYLTGDTRTTRCQSCTCDGGRWLCSENFCPARCIVEGQFVTTFDGKQYVIPGKCTYVVSQGLNWTITVQFSESEASLERVVLQLFQETFTISHNSVKVGEDEIAELFESENALVFWQSSMYVLAQTSFGMKIRVQMSPEIQLYITPAVSHAGTVSGLCGNNNNDTTDDFTTSSGITESSAQAFALSWSVGTCAAIIPSSCRNRDNELFADEKCSVLNHPTEVFAKCHGYVATDRYHTACIQRTCNCGRNLQRCLCVALGSYAKACASLGVVMGDWRTAANCTLTCQKNQEFSYDVQRCNHTCRSLSGPDPRCGVDDDPVEGCGCPEGTHLNQGGVCSPKAECVCHHYGSTTPPGPVVMDGRQCLCENGELRCSKDCGCTHGKVCVHCSEYPADTAQKTCDSLSKPLGAGTTCESGCYCPSDQFEDHHGNCVSVDGCTCVYGGKVFRSGQQVKTSCKTCVCGQGQWHCEDVPCPGKCQVYGNGHYQTFDSKWYRFDGHCQYTLVEDYCGTRNGSFSVRVESVPCCDEALTCSRSIILDLQGKVTLTLSDMRVTKTLQNDWTPQDNSLYSTHTVGLYIIISVPSRGITLIWDKNTRLTIELHPNWRDQICGLCGNFDSNEMNDLQISGSAVASGPLDFGNSWKATTPPCSDVTTEIFPCERNSYCSAWAQQRCMIIKGDTFKDCHLKVDPEPYYQACVQESCSCQFEGRFLGFCTAVAAYAEACSELEVCVRWRTPDLCPVYCDYYNEQSECTWHYEACGEILACNKDRYFTRKLEGCYPRCPKDAPYYDENTGKCTKLSDCTCYFNDTVVQPGTNVTVASADCPCENGSIKCSPPPPPPTRTTSTTASPTTVTSVPSTTYTNITSIAPTTEIPTTTTTTTSTTTVTTGISTEVYNTTAFATSSPTTSPATETTVPSTTPANTTEETTSLPTVQTWSTLLSTTPTTTTTTTSTTTVVSETPTEMYNTTAVTTVTATASTTDGTTAPESATSEATETVPSTSYTSVFTNATTKWTTASQPPETVAPQHTYSTGPTAQGTEETSTTPESSAPAQTSGPTEVTITEASTETSTSTATTQSATTSTESTAFTNAPSSAAFTSSASTTGQTTTGQPTTNITSTETTRHTSEATASTQSTTVTTELTTHDVLTGPPPTHFSTPQKGCSNCTDLKTKKSWDCGEMWIEDCFNKTCKDGTIELTPVLCPEPTVPTCPRGRVTRVSDGCCETWKCDCRCELYGDPHYISFQGVNFDFLDDCTYILVEEQSVRHHLTITVDNYYCVPGLQGSCAKGIILQYRSNMATLSIIPDEYVVQATLNNVTIQPPYEEHGFRFETTGYVVSISLPEVRSYVSLSPSYNLVVSLAMEHFADNTQGQCGVCGGGSCVRRGGQIEEDDCCDKTAYDWVHSDPLKPACDSAPRNVSCHPEEPPTPATPPTKPPCPVNPLCELLHGPVFSECRDIVNLNLRKKNCEFDSCTNSGSACSSLEQAAKECKNAGICIDWRSLTNGSCDVPCPTGLAYRECKNKLDDFCLGGVRYQGAFLENNSTGCFCPSGLFRAGSHSSTCVSDCSYCKGPFGEPRLPGEVWESNCKLCTCNNQTRTEECFPKPAEPAPVCGPGAVLVNTSCCGDQACAEKTCRYNEETYKVGDKWEDAARPCMSFSCSPEGIQIKSKVCPREDCPKEDRVWDNQHCCFTCNQSCAPRVSRFNLNIDNCTAVVQMPACQGQCGSQHRLVFNSDLQVAQRSRSCQEHSSERRLMAVHCSDLTTRFYYYKHITSCECTVCSILR